MANNPCTHLKMYIKNDKVGVHCTLNEDTKYRITCDLVCSVCSDYKETKKRQQSIKDVINQN
jgi:hypothetical protein